MDLMERTFLNIQEKSSLIWSVADLLRAYYKPHEYGKIILLMTVLKRFNDVLAPSKDKVLEVFAQITDLKKDECLLFKTAGFSFYNTSKYDFKKLLDDKDNIEKNFREYVEGFSENIQEILSYFDFDREIARLYSNKILYLLIEKFNQKSAYMGLDRITSVDMGYIFEDLVRRFSESYAEKAGAHFTSRDISYLMTDLLIIDSHKSKIKSVYDMTMGTSQMLNCMLERLKELDTNYEVHLYGQELNLETYAIAKADLLIRNCKYSNLQHGNTLSDDKFKGYSFDYIISNPPFGIEWKRERDAIENEAKEGALGRFSVGLPKISDGQMLFDLNGIAKLKDTGRMAIIHNGSSLFVGSALSGESEIRRYLIESDYLEAIIELPKDSFYNTNITTYIWLLTKNKALHRKNKVQLIDASAMGDLRYKNIGNKRIDITEQYRNVIVKAYREFLNKSYTVNNKVCSSKILNNDDLGYQKIQIETPLYKDGSVVFKGSHISIDKSKRFFENIPLKTDLDLYFINEIKPYNKDSYIDKSKTKIGYEISFSKYFAQNNIPLNSYLIESKILNKKSIPHKKTKLKESGIRWLGQIPIHWQVQKLRNILCERYEHNNPIKTEIILSLTNDKGVIPYRDKGKKGNKYKEDLSAYKIAYRDDLVLNSMNVVIGSVGISKYYGCVSPMYYVLYSKEHKIEYYNYIFQSKVFQNSLKELSNGILDQRMRIPMKKLNNVFLVMPPLYEQEKVVLYLDKKIASLNALIIKTKNIIEDYKKYKQAIITKAVTKGLNLDAQMKDSHVEYIGAIPHTWHITKLKYVATLNPKIKINNLNKNLKITFTPMNNIKNGYFINEKDFLKNNSNAYISYAENDIVMAKVSPCFENGNIAIMQGLHNKLGFGSTELFVFRAKSNIHKEYLFYFLRNEIFKTLAKNAMTGIGGLKRVPSDFILNFKITLPPLDEQKKIALYLDQKMNAIDEMIFAKENLIKDLDMYKEALIYECVTGKREID